MPTRKEKSPPGLARSGAAAEQRSRKTNRNEGSSSITSQVFVTVAAAAVRNNNAFKRGRRLTLLGDKSGVPRGHVKIHDVP